MIFEGSKVGKMGGLKEGEMWKWNKFGRLVSRSFSLNASDLKFKGEIFLAELYLASFVCFRFDSIANRSSNPTHHDSRNPLSFQVHLGARRRGCVQRGC